MIRKATFLKKKMDQGRKCAECCTLLAHISKCYQRHTWKDSKQSEKEDIPKPLQQGYTIPAPIAHTH